MSEAVVSSLITGGLALAGVILTVWTGNSRLQHKIELSQAVTDTRLTELTREVREHNHFARRVPVLEEKLDAADKRLTALERTAGK